MNRIALRRPVGPSPLLAVPAPTKTASQTLTRAFAALVLVIIGARIQLPQGLTAGYLLAALLIPVWVPVIRRYRGAPLLMALGAAAVVNGILLTQLARGTSHTGDGLMLQNTFVLVGTLMCLGVVLWARTIMSTWAVATFFAIGGILGIDPHGVLATENAWRFVFSVPLTVLLLALASRRRVAVIELILVLALAAMSMFNDARSGFAILMLTGVLVLWQRRPTANTGRGSAIRVVLALAVLAAIAYNLGQALILDGYFGAGTQQRTLAQISASGSLILGGRPEIAATAALMQHYPAGVGSGVYASSNDVLLAKGGMAQIGYDPNNGYVENFMFGTGFELHSMFGDLWVMFGLCGLAFGIAIVWYVLKGLGHQVAHRAASALLIFLSIRTLWAFFFGPWYGAATLTTLLLGVTLMPMAARAVNERVTPLVRPGSVRT